MAIEEAVIVTGASRGIGRSIAERLASDGRTVIGLSRSVPDDFPGILNYQVDLADVSASKKLAEHLIREHDVFGLVNNAGALSAATLPDATEQEFDEMVAVNLRAVFAIAKAIVPHMRRRRRGRIVNIGSRAALGKHARIIYGNPNYG